MKTRRIFAKSILGALCAAGLGAGAAAQPLPPYPQGWSAPPAAPYERPPKPPAGMGYAWVPGRYDWNGKRYVWIAGRYEVNPGLGYRWIDGRWAVANNRWVWISGHWG